jgi:hypothetical protein
LIPTPRREFRKDAGNGVLNAEQPEALIYEPV